MNKKIKTPNGNFVIIPKGSFIMGNGGSFFTYFGRRREEHPQAKKEHQVNIGLNLAVLETPVTISQYLEYLKWNNEKLEHIEYKTLENKPELTEYCNTDKTEHEFDIKWTNSPIHELFNKQTRLDLPMVGVTYQDCISYSNWLGNKIGYKVRLLTEAEWEYCCRATTNSTFYWGDDIKKTHEYAWSCVNSKLHTKQVKLLKPNNWSLYDMVGNIWEWCLDNYNERYYNESPINNPVYKDEVCGKYVIRGGSAFNKPETCRSTHRFGLPKITRNEYLGFRVLIEL